MNNGVYMSEEELSRAEIFVLIAQKRMTQVKAAEMLNLSVRQIERLYSAFKQQGIKVLASKRRGKPSNNKLPTEIRKRILELVTCELYSGFGPTLMHEKLDQLQGIKVSVETVRQKIDGSPHAWFEDRADPCDLIIYVDDATGHVYGQFFESETTAAYMKLTREYIGIYGRPLACYSDKHGIFRINKPGTNRRDNLTQFGRALRELDIELICANSPQAKGRVERAFQTLQDRLIKELRLARISSIEEGNEFLKSYWNRYNKQFAREPKDILDAHRKLLLEHDLDRILCYKEYRTISKNMEIQYKNKVFQLILGKPLKTLRGAKIMVLESLDGEITLEYHGKELPFRTHDIQNYTEEKTSKEIDQFLREKKRYRPPKHHPWNQESRARQRMYI